MVPGYAACAMCLYLVYLVLAWRDGGLEGGCWRDDDADNANN